MFLILSQLHVGHLEVDQAEEVETAPQLLLLPGFRLESPHVLPDTCLNQCFQLVLTEWFLS